MIYSNYNPVELTKVHYYNASRRGRNAQIFTISGNADHNLKVTKKCVIKKNIFGHKWVLKVNEIENLKKSRTKHVLYILVFVCIIVAVSFGVIFSIGKFLNKFNIFPF